MSLLGTGAPVVVYSYGDVSAPRTVTLPHPQKRVLQYTPEEVTEVALNGVEHAEYLGVRPQLTLTYHFDTRDGDNYATVLSVLNMRGYMRVQPYGNIPALEFAMRVAEGSEVKPFDDSSSDYATIVLILKCKYRIEKAPTLDSLYVGKVRRGNNGVGGVVAIFPNSTRTVNTADGHIVGVH